MRSHMTTYKSTIPGAQRTTPPVSNTLPATHNIYKAS